MDRLRLFFVVCLALCLAAVSVPSFAQEVQSGDSSASVAAPILVIESSGNPFTKYYEEILRAEGFNAFDVTDISQVTAATLASYDVAILGEMSLTSSQVSMFTTWVNGGGNLVAMRPDSRLATLLGLTASGTTLANAYLLIDTTKSPGAGLVSETIQYHGTADRYTLTTASAIATLYSSALSPTTSPAVTLRAVGTGHAAAFTYDLARSIVYTRQGNPAWAGQERDGQAPIRSDDLFFGAAAQDPQADWIDLSKVAIPQADEQQRLLANLLLTMTSPRKPLPRFWYLPRGAKAAVVMTGDNHGNAGVPERFDKFVAASRAGCVVDNWECIRGTAYIYPNTPVSDSLAASYAAQGFEIALHPQNGVTDYTPSSLAAVYTSQLAAFKAAYPSLPSPVTNRFHAIVWSDWASQPLTELANGMRLDTNYYYWPASWVQNRPGFFTGSGLPMRFAKTDGTPIDVYQAATQMTDESGQVYSYTADTLLDNALGTLQYYGVFTANMHTENVPGSVASADAIVASASARNVPVVSARQMLTWLDRRNGSSFKSLTWSNNVLSFTVSLAGGVNGLQAMLPVDITGGHLTGITLDGGAVSYTTDTIKGITYAFFTATAGVYEATYAMAAAQLAPSSLTFGNQLVNTTSAARTITLTNSGAAPFAITSIAIAGTNGSNFAQTNDCGTSLGAGASCTISVTFTPSAAGTRTATLVITDEAPASPQTATLTGNGTSTGTILTINPASIAFGDQLVGTTSDTRSFSLINSGTNTIRFTNAYISGTNASDFDWGMGTCGSSLAVGASCTLTATFSPRAAGARSAALMIFDNATGSPQSVAFGGSGVTATPAVTLSPSALAFASQVINTPSAASPVTLTNTGTASLTITGITITGVNPGDFGKTTTCGSSLAAKASCTINITFTPSAIGARSATLSVADNAAGSPHTVGLSGTGTTPPSVVLTPASLSFGNQAVGTTSAASSITVSNGGGGTLTIAGIALAGTNAGEFARTTTCGSSLAAGASCTISVTFAPTSPGTKSAAISITDNAAGSPHAVGLSGNAFASGTILSVNPATVAFVDQTVGTTGSQSITLTNSGMNTINFAGVTIGGANAGDFGWSMGTCSTTLPIATTCSLSVTFTPTATGARSATLAISSDATGSPHQVSLGGNGLPAVAAVSLSPTSVAFGNQMVGTTSGASGVTLTNTGTGPLTISGIAIGGTNTADFAQTTTCGSSLAAGASCAINVAFTPTATGARAATVVITDNAAGSPHSAALSGTGTMPAVTLNPTSVTFGTQVVGTSSAASAVTLSNTGTAPLTIGGIDITGANATDFASTSTCGAAVAAGGSCTISVTFTPTSTGTRSAAITITDNASGNPHSVGLSGTGTTVPVAGLNPTSVTFGSQAVGTTSGASTVTLSNTGAAPMTINGIAIGGTNAADFAETTTCGGTLAAGASCTIGVRFTPAAAGTRTATLSVTDNAAGSPHTVSLSGTGTTTAPSLSVTPSPVAFADQPVGSVTTMPVTLANVGGSTLTFTSGVIIGANATDFSWTVGNCLDGLTGGASCQITISFRPSTTGTRTATFRLTDNAAGSPQSITLTGNGTPATLTLTINPTSIAFGSQAVGTTSASQPITLTNAGTGTITFTNAYLTGSNAGDFAWALGTCGATLAGGASCTLTATFKPTAAGSRSASFVITDTAAASPHTILLGGTGN